jgi:hypothetical protein
MTRSLDDDIGALLDDLISQNDTSINLSAKKTRRGMNARSRHLINLMFSIVKDAQPITGRGVGYKLFVAKQIKSMSQSDMQRVYRLLKEAREQGIIPWGWIVDETRELERVPSWKRPELFAESAVRQYRRDFWEQQPSRCEVWSEKGTIRGVLQPVLDNYGVGFRVMHGYASATAVNDVAQVYDDARPLTALYVGDWDPSGLHMSEVDLPDRLAKYGGGHVQVKRIALVQEQLAPLPPFSARDKRKDPRYDWFVFEHGDRCWEIDALDPNELRGCVESHIQTCIKDCDAWKRCEDVNKAERESLHDVLSNWGQSLTGGES